MLSNRSPRVGDQVVVVSSLSSSEVEVYSEDARSRDTVRSGECGIVVSSPDRVANETKYLRVLFSKKKVCYVSEKEVRVVS